MVMIGWGTIASPDFQSDPSPEVEITPGASGEGDALVECPHCNHEQISQGQGEVECRECGSYFKAVYSKLGANSNN